MSEASALKLQVETLREIRGMAVEAAGAKSKLEVVKLPDGERGLRYLLVDDAGNREFVQVPPTPRLHTLHSLGEFPDYLKYAIDKLEARPVVWYSDVAVHAVLDDARGSHRQDRVFLEFDETPEFEWLREASVDGSQVLSQKELVFLLRSKLSACCTPSSLELLKVARTLSATTSTTAAGTIERHRESLGRDIENEVRSQAGEIPELMEFRCRVLTDPMLRVESVIRVMIEIDPRTLAIQLFPRQEDIRNATEEVLAEIGGFLDRECASESCQVFYGTP